MSNLIATVTAVPGVERVAAWQDRAYVNLRATRGSRARADTTTKIWIKGDVLTIEAGRGYHSDAYCAARDAVVAAVEAAGGTVVQR